jgi:hypothetical protein
MGYKRRKTTEGCLVNLSPLKFCFLKFPFFLQKTSVAVDGMKKFCSFYYPGNGMFLLSTPSKNANGSSLWIVNSTSEREIFSEDIRKEPQSVAFGCDQGNGSLVIGALNYQCNGVLVKDMNSGAEKK